MWKALYQGITIIGEIAKNLLAIFALVAALWTCVMLLIGNSPFDRLLDTFKIIVQSAASMRQISRGPA